MQRRELAELVEQLQPLLMPFGDDHWVRLRAAVHDAMSDDRDGVSALVVRAGAFQMADYALKDLVVCAGG